MDENTSEAGGNDAPEIKLRSLCLFITVLRSDLPTTTFPAKTSPEGEGEGEKAGFYEKIRAAKQLGELISKGATSKIGIEVQTVRIATNSFTEYMQVSNRAVYERQIEYVKGVLEEFGVEFFNAGPASTPSHTSNLILPLLKSSSRISASSIVGACDQEHGGAVADVVMALKDEQGGEANFRYCSQTRTSSPYCPFFPSAYAPSSSARLADRICVSIGLENGRMCNRGLKTCEKLFDIQTKFKDYYEARAARIVESVTRSIDEVQAAVKGFKVEYKGIDTSLNPSLDSGGSVCSAIESLPFVKGGIGGVGVMAACAAITTAIQSMPFMRTGYCGIMLPVCEDYRLCEIQLSDAWEDKCCRKYTVSHLMNVSSVCGVGIDTVPVPHNVDKDDIVGVIMDANALAERWGKPLSVRLFPVPDLEVGDVTDFSSPHLRNTKVFKL